MNYEKMTLVSLKNECSKRKLGTGRTRTELINKLKRDDEKILALANMSEVDLAEALKEAEPEIPVIEPSPVDVEYRNGSKLFCMYFEHTGNLLDSEHNDFRRQVRHLAVESGYEPYGGLYAARLNRVKDGYLFYEIQVH